MANDGSIISHFSHPEHELVKRHHIGPFLCDICWENLAGPAYGCPAGCDFAIHDTCAGHPQTLLSPEYHPHELMLVQAQLAHTCNVCAGSCTPRCFVYRCPPCDFDMHPRCVRLSPVVRGARHHQHDLTLVAATDDEGQRCAACHRGGAWYYHCTVCSNLDFHVSCAAAAGGGAVGNAAAGEPASEILLARINAHSDINFKIHLALGSYRRTRRFY